MKKPPSAPPKDPKLKDDKPNVLARVATKKRAHKRMVVEESGPDLRHDPRRTPPPMTAVTGPPAEPPPAPAPPPALALEPTLAPTLAPAPAPVPAPPPESSVRAKPEPEPEPKPQPPPPAPPAEEELVIVRGNYMDMLDTVQTNTSTVDAHEAEVAFRQAQACLASNDLARAEAHIKKALSHDPDRSDYVALSAWLSAIKPDAKQGLMATELIIEKLDRAIRLDPKCERARFYRGLLRKRLDRIDAAIEDFAASAALVPRGDGERELRLLEKRREADAKEKEGGLLGRLFKK